MRYENKKNGQIFETVGAMNDKYKTIMLRNVETGKEQTITASTLKRWYKKIEEEVAEEVDHIVITDITATVDCTQVDEEVETTEDTETAEEVKVKKVRKPRVKKDFTSLIEYIDTVAAENNMTLYVREKQPYLRNYRINGEGPVVFLVYIKSKAVLQCKTKLLPEEVYNNMKVVNHCFNRQFEIKTEEDWEFVKTVINSITVPTKVVEAAE